MYGNLSMTIAYTNSYRNKDFVFIAVPMLPVWVHIKPSIGNFEKAM
jgi:hypothetical protein